MTLGQHSTIFQNYSKGQVHGIDPINCCQCRLYLITVTTLFPMTQSHYSSIRLGFRKRTPGGIDPINYSHLCLYIITVTTCELITSGNNSPILQAFSKRLVCGIDLINPSQCSLYLITDTAGVLRTSDHHNPIHHSTIVIVSMESNLQRICFTRVFCAFVRNPIILDMDALYSPIFSSGYYLHSVLPCYFHQFPHQ